MDQLNQELEEFKEENRRLSTECLKLKKMIYILNEMNSVLKPIFINCKCIKNSNQIKEQLIGFRHKLQQINSNPITTDDSLPETNDFDSNSIINKMLQFNDFFTEIIPKTEEDIEQYENSGTLMSDSYSDERKVLVRRRGRGRPPKKSSYLVSKAAKIVSKSSKPKPKRKLIAKHFTNNSNIETKFDKIKGKVVTEEGREVFLSRTKRLRCQWPGCDAMFRSVHFLALLLLNLSLISEIGKTSKTTTGGKASFIDCFKLWTVFTNCTDIRVRRRIHVTGQGATSHTPVGVTSRNITTRTSTPISSNVFTRAVRKRL